MQHPNYLGKLKKGREKDPVTVRVIRKWTVKETAGQCAPLYVGMVLADAKGTAMYAEIPQETIPKKEHLLDIGKVYAISKFRVANAKTTYKPFDGSLMIELTDFTIIELAKKPPATIPEYIYRLTLFSSIVPVERTVFTYTDVIGYITKYTALHNFVPKGKERFTVLREVYLKDLSDNQLKVTLWGEHATGFNINHVYDDSAGNIVVWLLLGSIPRRVYNDYDKTYLSGSAACCYYFNPHIPEAQPFYSRFKDTPIYIERPDPSEEEVPMQTEDKPLKQKTLAELNLIDPFEFEDGTDKCAVTVTSIGDNTNWWYMSCKPCKKKAILESDGIYRCPKCQGCNVIPRYLLSFTARDDAAESRFFAYDEEAKQIIQKDCYAIMNPLAVARGLPQPLQDVIGKRYVFSIDLTDDSCSTTTSRQYLVKSVLEKPTRRDSALDTPASGTSLQLVCAAPVDAANTGTPATPIQSPQTQSEILHIQSTTQSTPAPSMDPDQSPSKNDDTRSTRLPTDARRNLLGALTATEKQPSEKDILTTSQTVHTTGTGTAPPPLEPKPKRAKSTSNKDITKDGSSKYSSADGAK